MVTHLGGLKFGSILEKLDLLGGIVAYKHALGVDLSESILERRKIILEGPTLVTASCESISVYQQLDINQDLILQGNRSLQLFNI
jgi:hypothetical protein